MPFHPLKQQAVLLVFTLLLFLQPCSAAIPIKPLQKKETAQPQFKESVTETWIKYSTITPLNPDNNEANPTPQDKGIYSILSLAFALTGLFPAAIVFGIIGKQNGRKYRAMASAGLLLGIIEGILFAFSLIFLLVLLA